MESKQFIYFVIITLMFISPALAHTGKNDYEHHEMMHGFCFFGGMMRGFGMGFWGTIIMILVVVALVLFIVWLIRQLQERKSRSK